MFTNPQKTIAINRSRAVANRRYQELLSTPISEKIQLFKILVKNPTLVPKPNQVDAARDQTVTCWIQNWCDIQILK